MRDVTLKAEQADFRPALHNGQQFRHRLLGFGRLQVPFVYLPECLEIAGARSGAAVGRRAELLQMQIADAVFVERGGELAF